MKIYWKRLVKDVLGWFHLLQEILAFRVCGFIEEPDSLEICGNQSIYIRIRTFISKRKYKDGSVLRRPHASEYELSQATATSPGLMSENGLSSSTLSATGFIRFQTWVKLKKCCLHFEISCVVIVVLKILEQS